MMKGPQGSLPPHMLHICDIFQVDYLAQPRLPGVNAHLHALEACFLGHR